MTSNETTFLDSRFTKFSNCEDWFPLQSTFFQGFSWVLKKKSIWTSCFISILNPCWCNKHNSYHAKYFIFQNLVFLLSRENLRRWSVSCWVSPSACLEIKQRISRHFPQCSNPHKFLFIHLKYVVLYISTTQMFRV
jgi:hypothetical protein